MNRSKGFVTMALAGLFARKETSTFSMNKYGASPKKERSVKMSKRKLKKSRGKKTRKNRGQKRNSK